MVGIFAYAFQTKEYVTHSGQSRTVQSISIECLLVGHHACLGAQIFLLRVKTSPKNRSTFSDLHGNKVANRQALREGAIPDGTDHKVKL